MALTFTTEGRVAFKVTIRPQVRDMARFTEAVMKTRARISHAKVLKSSEWVAVVWIRPTQVPKFDRLALAKGFKLISTRSIIRGEV